MTDLGVFCGNDAAQVRAFETWLGKPVGSVLAYTGNNTWGDADPGWMIGGTQFLGATKRRLRWSIPAWPKTDSLAQMRRVAQGLEYTRHQGWARACLAHRGSDSDPIYIRTAWELGGEWFHWTGDAKADPTNFARAVRQFYGAFKSVSQRFKTQYDFVPDRELFTNWVGDLYPGDDWIDIISQDVYWHSQYDGTDPVAAFARHNTGLKYGLEFCVGFARARSKGLAIPEWGVPGQDGNTLNGAKFIELIADWMRRNNCVFSDYWNSTSAYDGLLSNGNPAGTAAALKKLFTDGIGTVVVPPPPPPPPTTDWKARAEELAAENAALDAEVDRLSAANSQLRLENEHLVDEQTRVSLAVRNARDALSGALLI